MRFVRGTYINSQNPRNLFSQLLGAKTGEGSHESLSELEKSLDYAGRTVRLRFAF